MKKLKTPWFYVVVAIFMMFPSIAFGENDIYTDVKKSANE